MIANLRECKARLSAIVERASQGEEIIITVRGKPRARICPIVDVDTRSHEAWSRSVREARATYSTGHGKSSSAILDDLRSDRT